MPTLTGAILVNINKFSLFNTFLFTIFYNWLPNFIPHFLLILFYNISSTLWRENISFNRKGNTEWHTNQTWKKPWVSVKVIKQIISDVDLNISCFSPIFCSAIIFSSQSVIAGGDSDSGDTREHDTTIVWCPLSGHQTVCVPSSYNLMLLDQYVGGRGEYFTTISLMMRMSAPKLY